MEHQLHFGKKFYLDKKTGYWISTCCPKVRAHVWVWINHYGKIEKGLHIHHIDGNKSNNHISNLQIISPKYHVYIHLTEERRKKASEWMEIIRPLTKSWHSSEKGHKWHSNHAKQTFKRHSPIDKVCQWCSHVYEVDILDDHRSKYCSNKCKSKSRRHSGIDDIEVTCQNCSSIFKRNKYGKEKHCSRSCSQRNKNKKH